MTKQYLERMLAKFPEWLEKNSQFDDEMILDASSYASVFIEYVSVNGKDIKLKEL